jgi:hypothetical protein
MTVTEPERLNEPQVVVTVSFPEGREYYWLGTDSPMRQWQVGQRVIVRSQRWVVVARSESAGSLILRLDVDSHDGDR